MNMQKRSNSGIILLIDDDLHEHNLLKNALNNMGAINNVRSFYNGSDALRFLNETQEVIFLILCDVKMPRMDGLEFKRQIEGNINLKVKAIPFIFHSSISSDAEIRTAYSLNIQGFIKKADMTETSDNLKTIIDFWKKCVHPSDLNVN
jgi:CheY-like chemotaxis protein